MKILQNIDQMRIALFDWIINILFPLSCSLCEYYENKSICSRCSYQLYMKTEPPSQQICFGCQKYALLGLTHAACAAENPVFAAFHLWNYKSGNINNLIIQGKYEAQPQIFTALGCLSAYSLSYYLQLLISQRGEAVDRIIFCPVPLHPTRFRFRGYNQTELFCEAVVAQLKKFNQAFVGRCMVIELLTRVKHTQTQKELAKSERVKNLENAFAYTYTQSEVRCTDLVILVDDVLSTGSTLYAAATSLNQAGFKHIITLTIAFQPLQN